MNKQEREKNGIAYIPQYKKIWFSITKFEKYPEMATEGVGRAILYLTRLLLLFSLILSIAIFIKTNGILTNITNFIQSNIEEITYSDGNLNIKINDENKTYTTSLGTIIIDTNGETKNNYTGNVIAIENDSIIFSSNGYKNEIYYKDIFSQGFITNFDKNDVVNFINNNLKGPQIFITYFIIIFGSVFVITLIDVFMLSIFGVLTGLIANLKIRYRGIFNMAVYSITISTILQLIYYVINCFTTFEVKYFDLMYTAIAYICLTAAIFMIKSDVIKQQIELIKVIKEKQENKQNEIENEEKQEKEEEKEEKKEKEDKKEEQEKNTAEGQGSNA